MTCPNTIVLTIYIQCHQIYWVCKICYHYFYHFSDEMLKEREILKSSILADTVFKLFIFNIKGRMDIAGFISELQKQQRRELFQVSFMFIFFHRGQKGQPQYLVRATFTSFSRPSHLEIFILPTDAYLQNIGYFFTILKFVWENIILYFCLNGARFQQ